jgi:hypothetical protein
MSSELLEGQIIEAQIINQSIPFEMDIDYWDDIEPEKQVRLLEIWDYVSKEKRIFDLKITYTLSEIQLIFKSNSKQYKRMYNDLYRLYKARYNKKWGQYFIILDM